MDNRKGEFMGTKDDFQTFINNLEPSNISEMETTVGEIAKKLNKNYYDLDSDKESHMYIVGSVGGKTAIKGVSDLDLIFDLPSETYTKFNNYESNGQSALLQDVKNVLKERYTKTDISGDGQVVVINFSNYTVELVPGFKQSDDSFKYPDTHDGGKWKTTKPLAEIEESKKTSEDTNNNFKYTANMLRAWKNKQGFKFGGLLIDTLTYNFINEKTEYRNIGFDSYLEMTKELFSYLKDLNKEQSYWFALGSNQEVYNCENGKFITKATKAYDKIKDLTEESSDLNKKLREVFGTQFPKKENVSESAKAFSSFNACRNTEEFIEDLVPVDIRYSLNIDCTVSQNGWRDKLLSLIISNHDWLSRDKRLDFFIDKTDINGTYDIYWKVRNVGEEAVKRDMIRGQIVKTNSKNHYERTDFRGEHYVECYLVQNGVCVARNKIKVPISTI